MDVHGRRAFAAKGGNFPVRKRRVTNAFYISFGVKLTRRSYDTVGLVLPSGLLRHRPVSAASFWSRGPWTTQPPADRFNRCRSSPSAIHVPTQYLCTGPLVNRTIPQCNWTTFRDLVIQLPCLPTHRKWDQRIVRRTLISRSSLKSLEVFIPRSIKLYRWKKKLIF